MKTPREILLERHRAIAPRLNAVRAVAVDQLNNKVTKEQSSALVSLFLRCLSVPWRELILPSRRVWAGFTCTWVLIAVVNFAASDHQTAAQAKAKPTPVNMMLAWQQQQKLLTELENGAPDGDKPKSVAPKSRSDAQSLISTV